MKYITHLIHFEGPSHWRDEAEDDDDDFGWPNAHDNQAPTLEATGDVGVSSVEADRVEPGTEPAALGLVPSPKAELAALEAELAALEATGSEEISAATPAGAIIQT